MHELNVNKNSDWYDHYNIPSISVDDGEIEPKIKIYDHNGDYWFTKIGFNRKITDET